MEVSTQEHLRELLDQFVVTWRTQLAGATKSAFGLYQLQDLTLQIKRVLEENDGEMAMCTSEKEFQEYISSRPSKATEELAPGIAFEYPCVVYSLLKGMDDWTHFILRLES